MTVVLVADGHAATGWCPQVTLSPLAELGAGLHRLTSIDHDASRWAAQTWAGLSVELREECGLFSAIWGGYRARALLPTAAAERDFSAELTSLADMPLDTLRVLCGYALAGADHRHADDMSPAWLRRRAHGRGYGSAADLLIHDPDTFRTRLLAVLADCWDAFFAAEWQRVRPLLRRAADRTRTLLNDESPLRAVNRLISASRLMTGPDRLVVDKLNHAVIDAARSGLLLVPSVLGAPHVLIKHEPGWPAVVQFPTGGPGFDAQRAAVPQDVVASRLRILADPVKLQLCRMLARNPRSTQELAETLRMSPPEMSRHLRAMRELTLVSTERDGRFVLYRLRHDEVAALGQDVLELLLR